MYTLDTNAIIYYLHREGVVSALLEDALANGESLFVSAITEVELLRFSGLTEAETDSIKVFLSICSIMPVDSFIARSAASLGREYGLKLADSVIAATALFTASTLLTRNVRDFKNVPVLIVERV